MADNIIKVNVTANKTQRVTVSSANVGTEITASSDTGKFWAQTSKNWAVSENIVDGEDYSSKYYANKSKGYAQNAENFEAAARETYNSFVSDASSYIEELTDLKDAGAVEINEAVANGKDEINSTKTTILNDIEFVADGEKEEIKDLADVIKDSAEDIIGRVGISMFDTILKDHILTYEESKGLALQGTYVYKDAVAGSRYGYADFYNKVVEEYNNSEVYYLPWVQPIATGETTAIDGGDMVITASNQHSTYQAYKAMDGILSGTDMSTGWGTNKTTAVQWWQVKFPYKIRITGLTGYQRQDSTPANANTIGQFYTSSDKTTPIGDEYNNAVGVNWNAVSVTGIPAEGIITDTIYFEKTGGGAYGGLGELKIEATTLTPLYKNPNGHLFYDISEKEVIDKFLDTMGTAWFYGVDIENERVFLPRKSWLELTPQSKIPVIGNGNGLGLSTDANDTSKYYPISERDGDDSEIFTHTARTSAIAMGTSIGNATGGVANGLAIGVSTNPDFSGLITDLTSVLAQQTENYLYICVGNTESVSSVTDVVDVTTTENDTTPLFTGMYFDFTPNNVSWLKGGEQKNSGGVYTFCYNELVNELTIPKYGLKVINEADMIIGVDYSEYWKVNQDNMTFTTPTAISNKALSGAVIGNGMTVGLLGDNGKTGGLTLVNADHGLTDYAECYGQPIGFDYSSSPVLGATAGRSIGITTDPTKSGIIAEQSKAQLYFKVANAVQNLELLDAGEVLEAVADIGILAKSKTGQPDYTNAIVGNMGTTQTTTFTAPAEGWIFINIATYKSGVEGYATINGYKVLSNIGSSANYINCVSGNFYVHRGDVVYLNSPYTGVDVGSGYKFFPMKGAN